MDNENVVSPQGIDSFLGMGQYAQDQDLSALITPNPQEKQQSTPSAQGRSSPYDALFQKAEAKYGLPPGILSSIGFTESSFNPNAVNKDSGAAGLMGFMDRTAKEYGINPYNPDESVPAAGKKLAGLRKYYNGDIAKALAGYNAGERRVNKAIRTAGDDWVSQLHPETQDYIIKILGGQTQEPQAETYDIPLASGETLQVPVGMSREEALAIARAQGVDAVGLRDIPLATGETLQVPEHLTDEEAIAQVTEAHPDMDFTTQAEAELAKKHELIPAFKSGVLRGTGQILQGAGEWSEDIDLLKHVSDLAKQKGDEYATKAEGMYVPTSDAEASKKGMYGLFHQDFLEPLAQGAGSLAPLAAAYAVPVVGPVVGTAAIGLQETGAMANEAEQEDRPFSKAEALPYIAGSTVLNMIGIKNLGPLRNAFSEEFSVGAQQAIKSALEKGGVEEAAKVVGSKLGNIAKNVGVTSGAFASGDIGTRVLERIYAGKSIDSDEAFTEYGDILKSDLPLGIVAGGVHGHIAHAGKQGALEQIQAKAEQDAVEKAQKEADDPRTEAEKAQDNRDLVNHANDRLFTLERKAKGTPDQRVTMPETGEQVTVRGEPKQFLSPDEKAEWEYLKKHAENPEALAKFYTKKSPEFNEQGYTPQQQAAIDKANANANAPPTTEAPHWADTLGLSPISAKYKQLKQLDINNTDHHPAIKSILDSVASANMKHTPAAIESLYTTLDAMPTEEARKKKATFGEVLGYGLADFKDREGRITTQLESLQNQELHTAVHSTDITSTLSALSQSKNPIIRHLADVSKNLTGLTINAGELPGKKKNAGGIYAPATHSITINPLYAGNEAVVAHELTHANVFHAIENPTQKQKPAVAGLIKLHESVKNHPTLFTEYGIKNIQEFVAEGLSNPEFQYKLKQIKYENTTMWGKFTQSIADMLGIKRDNAFIELLTHTEKLLPSKPKQRKSVSPDTKPLPMFVGKRAATADKGKQEEALKRTLSGQDAEKVRQDTGWHRGADSMWRFEISDRGAKFTKKAFKEFIVNRFKEGVYTKGWQNQVDEKPKTLGDILHHPKLFEAYPSAKNIAVQLTMYKSNPEEGYFNTGTNEIGVNGHSEEQVVSTLLHEVQHYVQEVEDFAGGSNIRDNLTKKEWAEREGAHEKILKIEQEMNEEFQDTAEYLALNTKRLEEVRRAYTHHFQLSDLAYSRYINSHGEAEARNTQTRQDFSGEERTHRSPTSTLDVFQSSYDIRRGGEFPNANKISKATTPNVSRSAQPEVRQESKGAPISGEGVRASRPETGQAKEEKVGKVERPYISDEAYAKEVKMADYHHEDKTRSGISIMTPDHFLSLVPESSGDAERRADKHGPFDVHKFTGDNLPSLDINSKGEVQDHEGRARAIMAKRAGITEFPVIIRLQKSDKVSYDTAIPNKLTSQDSKTKVTVPQAEHLNYKSKNPLPKEEEVLYSEVAPDDPGLSRLRSADILVDRSPKGEELKKQRDKDIEKAQMAVSNQSTLGRTLNKIRAKFIAHDSALDYATREDKTFQANGEFHERILRNQAKERRTFISSAIEYGVVTRSSTGLLTINRSEALNLVNILERAHDLPKGYKAEDVERILTVLANEGHQLRYQDIKRRIVSRRADAAKLVNFANTFPKGSLERKTSWAAAQEIRKLADSDQRRVNALKEKGGVGQHITPEMVADAHSVMNSVPEIKAIVDDVHKVMQSLVDLLESTGNIDALVAREWRNPKYQYAPLYMSTDELESIGESNIHLSSTVKGIGKVKAKGVSEHKINMFENLQKHYAFAVDAAMENNYKSASLNWLAAHGSARELAYNKGSQFQQVVSILRKGKTVMFAIDDPVLFDAFKDIARLELPAFITAPSMVVRKGALINPMFWYRQLIRDPVMAWFTAQTGLISPISVARSFLSIITNHNAEYKEIVNKGVLHSQSTLADQKIDFIKGKKQRTVLQKGWSFAQHVHEAADAATRTEVYKAALKEARKIGGLTKEQQSDFAAARARDFMSFSNQGSSAAVRMINQSVPFFNSFLNGMDVLLRNATGMNMSKADAARARKIFWTRAMYMTTASMAYSYILSSNSQDYREAKADDWMTNWLMPGLGDRRMGKAASPFEIGVGFKLIPEAMVRQLMGLDTGTRSKELLFNAVLNGLTPPLPIPAFIKPILEALTGKSMFGKNPAEWFDIESPGAQNLVRAERGRGKSYIADAFSDATGISPAISQTLLKGYGTEVYNVADMIANGLTKGIGGDLGKDWTETIPYAKAFVTNPNALEDQDEVYSQIEKYEQIMTTITHLLRVGDPRAALYATNENMPAIYGSKAGAKVVGAMTKINQAMAYTKNDTSMLIEEKRKQMEELLTMKRNILDMGMGVIKEVEEVEED